MKKNNKAKEKWWKLETRLRGNLSGYKAGNKKKTKRKKPPNSPFQMP